MNTPNPTPQPVPAPVVQPLPPLDLAAHLFDLGCAMNRARAKELDPAREV